MFIIINPHIHIIIIKLIYKIRKIWVIFYDNSIELELGEKHMCFNDIVINSCHN